MSEFEIYTDTTNKGLILKYKLLQIFAFARKRAEVTIGVRYAIDRRIRRQSDSHPRSPAIRRHPIDRNSVDIVSVDDRMAADSTGSWPRAPARGAAASRCCVPRAASRLAHRARSGARQRRPTR